MCLVECVSEEEISLFAQLSGSTPVSDCLTIEPKHVATLAFCRPVLLGAHRYVHVAFHDSEDRTTFKPCSLVICASGEGQTEQYVRAFRDAIHVLLTTWEPIHVTAASKTTLQSHKFTSLDKYNQTDRTTYTPPSIYPPHKCVYEPGCMIPVGGAFEFLLSRALLSDSVSDHTGVGIPVSQLLAKALLSVPRQIYSHSPRHFLQTQTRVMSFTQNHSRPFSLVDKQEPNTNPVQNEGPPGGSKPNLHCCRKGDMLSKAFTSDLGLESVSCKYQLLLAVLQCVTSLLRVDAMLRTHTVLHSKSCRLTNISWKDTEGEAED
ncbi:Bardet-Biedl syndrome 10 protein isoform X2 [Mugil cephalus]|nr:Bardet-Biedl syndrome 10 protein isoform X2 [Mugil cephalus]